MAASIMLSLISNAKTASIRSCINRPRISSESAAQPTYAGCSYALLINLENSVG